jgi:hypothetical protein
MFFDAADADAADPVFVPAEAPAASKGCVFAGRGGGAGAMPGFRATDRAAEFARADDEALVACVAV